MNAQEVKNVIGQWVGHDILLTKQEDGDIDKTIMSLEKVSLVERGETIDGYVSPAALQLRGQGNVLSGEDGTAPLPYERYDIPLTDNFHMCHSDDTLFIETERATYTVTLS